jgi:hypothetical protein
MGEKVFLIVSLFIFSLSGHCQSMLTGQILSGKTQEGIPFSHIYISEFPEFIAISNEDGRFVLRIPQGAEQISISHINYRKLTLSLEEFKKQAVIYLEENEQSLGEVTVEFFTPKSLMEKVIENLEFNHLLEPVCYDFYMRLIQYSDIENPQFIEEHVGKIFQNKNHNSSFALFKTRFFAFEKKYTAEKTRTTSLYEVMTDNLFKYKEDIFVKRKLKNFKLQYLEDEIVNDRPSYVLRYHKGDTTAYQDNGYLFIDKETFGVSRMVMGSFFTENYKDIYFKLIENKWYLNFTKYPRSNFSTGSISERLTMYSISQEIPSDLQFYPASSLVRPFVSDFASDFNDEFWEDKNFIPLPQWIIENLK